MERARRRSIRALRRQSLGATLGQDLMQPQPSFYKDDASIALAQTLDSIAQRSKLKLPV